MVSDERALATSAVEARRCRARPPRSPHAGSPPSASWRDFFDAAAALLDAASIDRALTRLPRTALRRAARRRDAAADARRRRSSLCSTTRAHPSTPSQARIAALRRQRPDAFEPADDSPGPPTTGGDSRRRRARVHHGGRPRRRAARVPARSARAHRRGRGERRRSTTPRRMPVPSRPRTSSTTSSPPPRRQASPRPVGPRVARDAEPARSGSKPPTLERWRTLVAGFLRASPRGPAHRRRRHRRPRACGRAPIPLDPDWPAHAARASSASPCAGGCSIADGTEPVWTAGIRARARDRRRRRRPRTFPPRSTGSTCRPT